MNYLDKQGLTHVFAPGEDAGAAFDQRLAGTTRPAPVRALAAYQPQLVDRLAALRSCERQLTQQLWDLTTTTTLSRRVDALATSSTRSQAKIRRLERHGRCSAVGLASRVARALGLRRRPAPAQSR